MKTVILSLGGSIIVPGDVDVSFLKKFKLLIDKHSDKRFVIVCGGGKIARSYMEAANKISSPSPEDLDWIGIGATRLNAELLRSVFGKVAHDVVILNPKKKIDIKKRIIIAAGYEPGCSTDYDAVLLATQFGADLLINLSNISHAYDKDPSKHKDAKKLEDISWADFRGIVGSEWKPGLNMPFDPIASKEAEKIDLKVIIAKGTDLANLEKILSGEKFKGTVIE